MLNDRMLRVARLWEQGRTVEQIAEAMRIRRERVRRDLEDLDLEVHEKGGCGEGLGIAGTPVGGGPVEVQGETAKADCGSAAVPAV